ncbi:MAG: DnaA/Hda family protein [Waddliaceae bacterium]
MQAWENFLKKQENELGAETVDKWLRSLKIIRFDACNLYLEAKDFFHVMWFEEHIRKKVLKSLVNNNKHQIKVHLTTHENGSSPSKKKVYKQKTSLSFPVSFPIIFDELDPHCTLENTIASENQLLAYKLLCKITNYDPISATIIPVENHLAAFNPIFLFGDEGTGKSHLLMAATHALRSCGFNVIYARAETFTKHVVSAIRGGEMSTFRQTYRNTDVLLIDDVQFFSRKSATQEELFHTFNALHLSGKQMIFSADCAPGELLYIEPRLVSRFEWGIVLPLSPLSQEEIGKLLEKKIEAMNIQLHPTIQEFLLSTFLTSRSLTQAIEALALRHYLKQQQENSPSSPLTLQTAKELLMDMIKKEKDTTLTSEKIIDTVSDYFGVSSGDIVGKKQTRNFTLPRYISMYLCREKLKASYTSLGKLFFRNHSTIMTGIKQIKEGIENNDKEITGPFCSIEKKLNV